MALRHRKKSKELQSDLQQTVLEQPAVGTTTFEGKDDPPSRRFEQEDDDGEEEDEEEELAFRFIPLVQRPLLLRLDVGPFVLAYVGLIVLDTITAANATATDGIIKTMIMNTVTIMAVEISWTTIGFLTTFLLHLSLVIGTQWSVILKADVGYSSHPYWNFDEKNEVEDEKHIKRSNIIQWTHCLVQSAHKEIDGSFVAGIVSVDIPPEQSVVVVTFQDKVFRYCRSPPDVDVSLWMKDGDDIAVDTTITTPRFRPLHYPTSLPLEYYAHWRGHSSVESTVAASQVYGKNMTAIQLPPFTELLAEQLVAPFFLFQVFCVVLWSLDEYWYYAMFTLFALLMFESTVAYNRLKSLQRLHDISHKNQHQRVWVRRGMGNSTTNKSEKTTNTSNTKWAWISIPVAELIPGDWVSLSGNHVPVPADILLLHGNAICDEALLTGESVPQLKQSLDTSSSESHTQTLDLQDSEHKESILFGGTVLVAGTEESSVAANVNTSPPDKGITGIVLRTGFETAQGNLLRTMAHSSKKADGVHTLDTFVFILLLILCAVGAASYVLREGWYDERRNRFRLLLHVVIIVTSVVPPELPMELSLAVTNSVSALMKRSQVYCTEHFRIPWAGQVNVCCFDKTGTLTSDEMRLKGVRIFNGNAGDEHEKEKEEELLIHPSEKSLPWATVRVMAACHSLAFAGTGKKGVQLIGDPLEQAVVKESGYQLKGNNTVLVNNGIKEGNPGKSITILHRFAFSSKLKRMTVLAVEEGGNETLLALSKGAPETIRDLLSKESIPSNYDEVSFHHMSRGRRVLAMAYREVGNITALQRLKESGRDSVENSLVFAGFLVLDCPLKPDTKHVISELRKSGHSCVMITGDALLTATEVARQVGIIRKPSSGKRVLYSIQKRRTSGQHSNDSLLDFECVRCDMKENVKDVIYLSEQELNNLVQMTNSGSASFCISGDVLVGIAVIALYGGKNIERESQRLAIDEKHLLLSPPAQILLAKLVPCISVFARHAPHHKEAVVAAFNRGGYQTLMCGDGTNDVGALKRAHVGISIISDPEIEAKQREAGHKLSRARGDKINGKSKKSKKYSSVDESLRQLREAQEDLDLVELGDASVAAPFTSRAVSIRCCKDVIQQGRCTLVTMLQIYKILGINCLVNAFVLSKLFLHGVKQGDRQLTVLGIVVAALFFFVTRAEPLSTLSSIRPPASVLCAQALISIIGQCFIHLATILLATDVALSFVDPFDPSLVPDGQFNPNTLNTCTFILTSLATGKF
jgi:cation-transporting ATPase 13A1